MDEKKEKRIALAVIRQLRGLSYHDAEQILIWVFTLLKEKSTVTDDYLFPSAASYKQRK